MGEFPWLSLLTFLPVAGAAALAFVPGDREVKGGAFATSIAVFAVSIAMLWWWPGTVPPGLAFVENHEWIPALNVRYHVGIDGISLAMILLTTLLTPIAILASWHIGEPDPHGGDHGHAPQGLWRRRASSSRCCCWKRAWSVCSRPRTCSCSTCTGRSCCSRWCC